MNYIPHLELEPDNDNLYNNGTPFDKAELVYNNLIGGSIPYLKTKQPVFIVLIGGQSSGKTTLGIHLIDIYNHLFSLGLTDLTDEKNPQYAQGNKEFLHKLPICGEKGFPAHEWDEAGKYSRKNSLTNDNKAMDESLDVLRVHKVAVMMCRHDIHKIPRELVDHEILGFLIRCKMRSPNTDYVEAEVYDFIGTQYIIDYINKGMKPQQVYNKLVYPAFHFRFKDLSPERSALLDKLCSKKKKDMWAQKDIKAQGLITLNEIHLQVPRSKIWIKKKFAELKVMPKMSYKNKNYYNEDVIKQLMRVLKK